MPCSLELWSRVRHCRRDSASRIYVSSSNSFLDVVGTLWSEVASVRSGRRTMRWFKRSPSNACCSMLTYQLWSTKSFFLLGMSLHALDADLDNQFNTKAFLARCLFVRTNIKQDGFVLFRWNDVRIKYFVIQSSCLKLHVRNYEKSYFSIRC